MGERAHLGNKKKSAIVRNGFLPRVYGDLSGTSTSVCCSLVGPPAGKNNDVCFLPSAPFNVIMIAFVSTSDTFCRGSLDCCLDLLRVPLISIRFLQAPVGVLLIATVYGLQFAFSINSTSVPRCSWVCLLILYG